MMSVGVKKPNWAMLAGLRFLLAFLVLCGHLPAWAEPSAVLGFFALFPGTVIAFYMISGYSIRASLAKNTTGFYSRRIARIYPVYFVSVFMASAVMYFYGPVLALKNQGVEAPMEIAPFLINAIGLQSVFAPALAFNSPSWSLGLEIFFYALAPLLLKLKSRGILALMIVSGLAYYRFPPMSTLDYGALVALKFAWPFLLGWVLFDWREKIAASPAFAFGALAFACWAGSANNTSGAWPVVFIYTIFAIAYGSQYKLSAKAEKWALYGGELSYPMYILHFPVCSILWKQFGIESPWLHVAGVIAVSAIVYHLVDKPLRARAARHAASKKVTPQAAPEMLAA